ncbi:MAG: VWA domain-containing protein [Rhodococcus sp.]|nr:VWA domain-containing protein [Rhodococcus sp. (in: high G+C Gram-positive bacteria)]
MSAQGSVRPGGRPSPYGLPGHLVDFVEALRRRGIEVGPSETVDAGHVMSALNLLDRESLREGLACALLRRPTHRATYDALFDLWFPAAIGSRSAAAGAESVVPRDENDNIDIDKLQDVIAALLADDSPEAAQQLQELVTILVEELGSYTSASGQSFSAYQAMRDLSPSQILEKVLNGLLGDQGAAEPDESKPSGDYESEVALRAAAQRLADFKSLVENETRRRSAETLGRERVANYGVPQAAENIDFLRASDTELTTLRRNVAPLARLLASRLAVRRSRGRSGAIDLRRTLRKSMSTGGVPIDLVQRKPRRARPELVILCDVSGSVAGFSHFTLLLVHALREQFSRVRIFAFIDSTDEVTRFFEAGSDLGVAMSRMVREATLVTYDGHSDYGHSFAVFAERFSSAVTPRSSVLILGDGRTNYRDPNIGALARMVSTARHTYWLNPEPRGQWGTGDSAANVYREVVGMYECRTAAQLAAVVAGLLPV